jgi:nitrogen fixation/metabolism regulation signal transduction histidine kinase
MDQPGEISILWDEEKNALIIDDQGPGFELDKEQKYVEPFFTTKDTGTGLGLAIVSTIIGNHRARLILAKNPAGGGRVEVIFPNNDTD